MRFYRYFRSRNVPQGIMAPYRREFIRTQMIKGLLGLALAFGYLVIIGRPDGPELLVFAGLVAPLGLAWAGRLPIRRRVLEASALALFAALITLVSTLTGG